MKSFLKNRTIFTRDNLEVMRGMADECIDLIYLDPPFNSNHDYSAPIGSQAAGAEFRDTWTLSDIDVAWYGEIAEAHPGLYDLLTATQKIHGNSMMSYLIYMAVRIMEMKRILKPNGSIYLHCDPTASHYLKLLMDEIFGKENFRNEILWHYSGWNAKLKNKFNSRHDTMLFYSKGKTNLFNSYMEPWKSEEEYIKTRKQKVHKDDDGNKYVFSDAGGGKRVKRYLKDAMDYGRPADDVWDIDKLNNSSKESVGYPTQKPVKLLERIIKASSNEGDIVLDPFCGCATTCVAAEKLERKWVGIDISPKAAELVKERIHRELGILLFKPIHRRDIPQDRGGERSKNIKHTLYGMQEGNVTVALLISRFRILKWIILFRRIKADQTQMITYSCFADTVIG